uniref:Uncharacterized protein n=1 Tax=Anguilla anguilla TaxID=7936 RepID=A0A0E9W7F1_ANGAN
MFDRSVISLHNITAHMNDILFLS